MYQSRNDQLGTSHTKLIVSQLLQARSIRNTANRSKLKILVHIRSKPIREIICQKGGKDGNPPDLATIFFETHKKDNKLVDPEAIEKMLRLKKWGKQIHLFLP